MLTPSYCLAVAPFLNRRMRGWVFQNEAVLLCESRPLMAVNSFRLSVSCPLVQLGPHRRLHAFTLGGDNAPVQEFPVSFWVMISLVRREDAVLPVFLIQSSSRMSPELVACQCP